MKTIIDKIKEIYPTLTDEDFNYNGTIILQNDSNGQGDYIKLWTNKNPMPTQEQLDNIKG